jgi:YVTN family beta-propeller protein
VRFLSFAKLFRRSSTPKTKKTTIRRPWRCIPFLERLEPRWLPSIFTVTNTNDSGAGSLRQAILDANTVAAGTPLYIANAGNNTLTVVDSLGNASTFASTGLSNPEGVAVDAAGNVYVANVFTANIEKFSSTGQDLGAFATTGVNDPGGMRFDSAGNLYLANVNSNNVEKYSPTGQDLGSFVTGVFKPTDVAFDASGNLYVAASNNIVEKFSPTGTDLGAFITTGLAGPDGLAFDSQGNLYVSNYPGNYVEKYSLIGADLGQFAQGTEGLTFDSQGNLYAVTNPASKVEKYSSTGTDLGPFGSGLVTPTFLAFGPKFQGVNTIHFNIPTGDPGFHSATNSYTITPLSVLPTITGALTIDGTSEPGFAGTPIIELDGASAGSGVNGLTIPAANSTIEGLVINRFGGIGIVINGSGASGNVIQGNYIGTDVTGTVALANGSNGVTISTGATNNTIGGTTAGARNLISGNSGKGVEILGAGTMGNVVEGNYVGTDVTGTATLGNAFAGIQIDSQASGNTIGGSAPGAGNVIAASGLPAGIVSWWRADGTAFDSVSGNNGALENGATYAAGKAGQAFSLNGSSQFVQVANVPALNPTQAITVEAWIDPAGHVGGGDPIVKKAGEGFQQQDGYALEFHNTNSIFFAVYVNGLGWQDSPLSAAIPSGQWTHVTGVYDGTHISLYINGVPVGSPTFAPGGIIASSNPLEIGGDPSDPTRFSNGLIDDAAIYSRALSGTEIQAIYNAGGGKKLATGNATGIEMDSNAAGNVVQGN